MDTEYIGYTSHKYSERLEIVATQRIYIRMSHIRTNVYMLVHTDQEAQQHTVSTQRDSHDV